jgi:hypothetical protein
MRRPQPDRPRQADQQAARHRGCPGHPARTPAQRRERARQPAPRAAARRRAAGPAVRRVAAQADGPRFGAPVESPGGIVHVRQTSGTQWWRCTSWGPCSRRRAAGRCLVAGPCRRTWPVGAARARAGGDSSAAPLARPPWRPDGLGGRSRTGAATRARAAPGARGSQPVPAPPSPLAAGDPGRGTRRPRGLGDGTRAGTAARTRPGPGRHGRHERAEPGRVAPAGGLRRGPGGGVPRPHPGAEKAVTLRVRHPGLVRLRHPRVDEQHISLTRSIM